VKKWLFFPFLIAIHPVLASYAGGGKWQPIEYSARPLIVLFTTFILFWLVLAGMMKSWTRSAYALSVFWFLFFAFGDVNYNAVPQPFWLVIPCFAAIAAIGAFGFARAREKSPWPLAIFIAAVIVAGAAIANPLVASPVIYASVWCLITLVFTMWAGAAKGIEKHVSLINVVTIGFMVLPVNSIISFSREAMKYEATMKPAVLETGKSQAKIGEPDVYLFVLDAYGRQDALKRTFNFDNSPFIDALKQRGFYIASHSRSNYAQTEQSFASELNGNYLGALLPEVPAASRNRSLLNSLADESALERAMVEHGYKFVTISTGFPLINRDSDLEDLSDPPGPSLAEIALCYRTPEAGLCLLSPYFHQLHRDRITHAINSAALLPATKQPKFVLVHILAPHPPFVFDAEGNPINPDRQFGLWDANGFVFGVGSGEEYFRQYPQQVQYINKLMLRTVDLIQSQSTIKPVIIIQGDHGSRKGHDMTSLEGTDPTESYENLMAIAAPPSVRKNLYDSITPINLPRALLSGLFGGPFQKLPDRSIYSTWVNPYEYTDVTDKIPK